MKFYLSLIILLLISPFIYALNADCEDIEIKYSVFPVTNCETSNGLIIASVEGGNSSYSFRWFDSENRRISNSFLIYGLEVGDYKLNVISKEDSRCKVLKEFFVHGLVNPSNGCLDNIEIALEELSLGGVMFPEADFDERKYDLHKVGFKGKKLLKRTNNPNEKAGPWTVVPKPISIPVNEFKLGNTYEFVACYICQPQSEAPDKISAPFKMEYNESVANRLLSPSSYLNENFLKVSPQPAMSFLNIELLSEYKISSIELVTINGHLTKSMDIENFSSQLKLDIQDLDSGIYLLKAKSNANTIIKKVIIK